MLKLYNKEHEVLSALTSLKDYKIEYVLSGEDCLEFSLSRYDENIPLIEEECYIRTKYNEYVIKAIEPSDNFKRFTCNINIESLVGKVIKSFDTKNNNINDTIRLTIAGTGWTLADNSISKKRTVSLKNTNALEVLRKVRETFRVDFRFDAINKIIYVYEKLGSDKGVYFTDELNLISLDVPSDSYDYATRLYARGKDGLTFADINNGKDYIENFQYSNKIIEKIWEDNRYTNKQNLKEDAEAKLEELSKPRRNYNVQVYDLAKNNSEFSFLDFSIGDTVTIISNLEKFKDKQRIVKYIEYPEDPSKNTCELGNTTLTFEELQKANEAKNQVVENITSDNGTVDGSKVDSITTEQISDFEAEVAKITDLTVINAEITNLKAQNVTITGKLNAIEGEFGTLKANVGVIDKLTVTHTAQINSLEANKASITQLNAVSANIGSLEVEVGKIQTLVNGNLTSDNIHSLILTSGKVTVENGFIKNAMIENVDVSKVNAGDISTNKFRIKSDDGGIEIVGATQQFKDKNNKVRIQMGKDTQGNFNFIIRGEDGTTTLIDHTGIKEKAIADDLIKETMIAQDAVGEKQINYSSFITGFNKDTNTNTIKSTKIMLNNQNQTLEVAFNSLKTQADGTKSLTESHSTTIGVMQGQITGLISDTTIVEDGTSKKIKDAYTSLKATVNGISSKVSSVESSFNNLQIGGRNLFLGTKDYSGTKWRGSLTSTFTDGDISYKKIYSKTTDSWNKYIIQDINIEANTDYIMSALVRKNTDEDITIAWRFDRNNPVNRTVRVTSKSWTRVVFPISRLSINSSGEPVAIFVPKNSVCISESTAIDIAYIEFEKGNKAGSWSPAPEDIDSSINDVDTKVTALDITVKSTSSKVSAIEQSIESITQRVSSTETNVTTVTNTANAAKTQADKAIDDAKAATDKATSAQSSANSANSKIDGLQIGGENLVPNSDFYITSGSKTGLDMSIYKELFEKNRGKKITCSLDVKLTNAIGTGNGSQRVGMEFSILYKDGTRKYIGIWEQLSITPKTMNTRISGTATLLNEEVESIESTGVYIQGLGGGSAQAGRPQVELGSKASSWKKSTRDIETEISSTKSRVSSIETDLSGITQRVSTVENKQTTVDGKVTNLETWKKSAEQKITDSAIVATVKSAKNTDGKNTFAQQSDITQLNNSWTATFKEGYNQGIVSMNKEGITVTSSGVKSKTSMSANGFKITKTDTNEEVFKVNSSGRLLLDGEFTTHNGNRKSGYFGLDQIKFYNWWSDSNEAIAFFYGGKTSDNKRSADVVGRDMVSLGVGQPNSGTKVLEGSSSTLKIYKNTDFNGYKITNLNAINEDSVSKDLWINKIFLRTNQINSAMDSGNLNINYWRGGTATSSSVKVCDGTNSGTQGKLQCGDFKAYGTKNACVQTDIGYVDINAYETADYYFGDIGETILDNDGYSYVYIDSLFAQTVNTTRKYQVFLSVYGEGYANVIERHPTHFIIKGTPNLEVGYEIKAKRKGYEDYRLERDVNSFIKGEEHGLDLDYKVEKSKFEHDLTKSIQENLNLENKELILVIDKNLERSIGNKELINLVEERIEEYENIN